MIKICGHSSETNNAPARAIHSKWNKKALFCAHSMSAFTNK